MPDCEYFEELCSMALDGELSRAQKRELDAHLAECPCLRGLHGGFEAHAHRVGRRQRAAA